MSYEEELGVSRLFKTMDVLEKYYYDPKSPGILEGPSKLPGGVLGELLQKQAPHLTTTAGVWQAIYGRRVWGQLNYEVNAFSILGKKPWDRSGWRVKTAKAASSGGGIAETGTLPVTVKAAYQALATKPKIHGNTWESSELLALLSEVDDAIDILAVGREDGGLTHRDLINLALCKEFGTLAGNQVESIDRMCASTAERTACGEHDGDEDPWNAPGGTTILDRSANAWSDSNILHNSNVDRDLSLTLIDTLYRTIYTACGENPHVVMTGYDTLFKWGALLQSQQRYFGNMTVQPTYNGVRAVTPGVDGAFNVSSYFEIPIICSKDVAVDTISRIYMLNEDYLWLKVAKPSRYFETSDPFVLNALATRGFYETVFELLCTFFKAQGKIRDLK